MEHERTQVAMNKLIGKTVKSIERDYKDQMSVNFTDGTLAIFYYNARGELRIDAGK